MGWAVRHATRTKCLVDWSQHNRWAHNATGHPPILWRLSGIAARLGVVASFVLRAVDKQWYIKCACRESNPGHKHGTLYDAATLHAL